ncbi:MAG: hypothetical protein O9342_05990 [Beijerinckiaceae bacterium]|nr:hypothetical protein [Beijerinckiaceae bacterium]
MAKITADVPASALPKRWIRDLIVSTQWLIALNIWYACRGLFPLAFIPSSEKKTKGKETEATGGFGKRSNFRDV